jgi:hypothetical protein
MHALLLMGECMGRDEWAGSLGLGAWGSEDEMMMGRGWGGHRGSEISMRS